MKKIVYILLPTLLVGCAVGPNFRSPALEVPQSYTTKASDSSATGDISQWWRTFNDPTLDSLIDQAIAGNKNLASAIKNIELARLEVATAKAAALPSIGLGATAGYKYAPDTKVVQSYSVGPTIAWDIDLWGKVRREAEAAGASFHATEWQSVAIMQTLAANVATTYFTALSYRDALEVARSTYRSREMSQQLMDSMFYYGSISEVSLAQSRASMATAGAMVEQYSRSLGQTILALNLLLGENPRHIDLTSKLQPAMIDIPVGLPSALLERRPDVIESYYAVQQANAMIGVAVAARLPSISLTGSGGLVTTIVQDAATGRPVGWSAAASLVAPILNWGTLKRNERAARIRTEQALLAYEESMLQAINDVEQALIAVSTYKDEVGQSALMVSSSQTAAALTSELYRSGSSSYLDVLDADRTLLSAQLQYIETTANLLSNYVTLYKALGGGFINPDSR